MRNSVYRIKTPSKKNERNEKPRTTLLPVVDDKMKCIEDTLNEYYHWQFANKHLKNIQSFGVILCKRCGAHQK